MKKLLIMLSAVALATGAFADEEEVQTATLTSGTETFEGFVLNEGPVNISTNTVSDGKKLWYSAGDAEEGETGAVTAYADGETKPANGADANANYLNVSTTTGTPLYRKLAAHDNETGLNEDSAPVDIGTGIFVDTYVQFSGSESAPQLPPGSKLVVWVQAIDFDDNNTAETSDDIQGSTNLVVTAAMLSDAGEPTATNFVIETDANFNFEGWHRLTIRSIKEITSAGSKIAGFTVFVDGVQLAAKAEQVPAVAGKDPVVDENDEEVEAAVPGVPAVTYADLMGEYDYANNLTAEAKAFYNNRRLFVSLVNNLNDYAQTLSAVGFDGTGKIDNLTVSNDRSDFVFARGDFYFTLTWDNGIADFTVTAKDAEGNELPFTLEMEDLTSGTPFAITNTAAKITISGITPKDGSSLVGDDSRELDLLEYSSLSLTTETNLAEVDGMTYTSFTNALAAAKSSGKLLTLMADVTLTEAVALGDNDVLALDLNGKTITAFANVFNVAGSAQLSIITSVDGGAILHDSSVYATTVYLVNQTGGTVVLGNTDTDKGVRYYGAFILLPGSASVLRGSFDANLMTNGDTTSGFYVDTYYAAINKETTTYTETPVDGYWVVTPNATPEPTLYAITVTAPANATAAITTNGVAYTDKVPTGTSYAVVVTPGEGYTYADVDLTGTDWVLDGDTIKLTGTVGDADVTIADVPAPAAAAKEIEAGTTKSFDYIEDAEAATNGVVITVSSDDAAAGITPDYFKPVITPNGNTFVVGVELDETVIQPSADDAAETFIENLATAEVDEHGKITIKFTGEQVKRGLKYGVAVSESLTGENSIQNATPETWATANNNGVDLKVTKPIGGKGFFKVHIKYETSTPAE